MTVTQNKPKNYTCFQRNFMYLGNQRQPQILAGILSQITDPKKKVRVEETKCRYKVR